MAVKHSSDDYGSDGSVPDSVPMSGSGAGPMQVRADPNDFGAQIGGAVKGLGEEGEQVAKQFGDIQNNALATQAEANLAIKIGQIKGDYLSKTGMEAVNSYPQYQQSIQDAYQESNQNLPLGAQVAYETNSKRMVANHLADGSGYAATQLKQANIDAGSNLQNVKVQELLDPSVAGNVGRTYGNIAAIGHIEQSKIDLDHPGLKTDPDTGNVSFDESKPEGQALKAQYQQKVDTLTSQAQINRFSTLMKSNVMAAHQEYQLERDMIPPQGQVAIDALFKPQIFNTHADNVVGSTLQDAAAAHAQMLYNPQQPVSSARDSIPMEEWRGKGQAPTSDRGAVGNHQIEPDTFKMYAKPGEIITNPKNNTAVYNRIMDDYEKRWPNDPARQAVAYFSGTGNVSPAGSATPYIKNTNDGHEDVATYAKNVTGRIATIGPIENVAYNTTRPQYGTNAVGAPLTQADYFQMHSADVYAKGDTYAEQTMPGNLEFKQKVRSSLQQSMQTAIANQTASYKQDNSMLMRAFNGDFTKGKHPASLDEMNAIPGIKDVLNRASVNSPDFVRELDTRLLTAASRGDSKDAKEYGDKIYDFQKRLTLLDGDPNKLTNPVEVMKGVGDGLTLAGQDYLLKKMEKDPVELQQENAMLAAGKNMLGVTKEDDTQWPTALVAINKFDEEQRAKGIPASSRYAGIDNKDSVLHALTPFIPTDIEQARTILNQTTSSWIPSGIPTPSRLISHLTGEDQKTDFERNFTSAMDNKNVTPESAEKLLGEALVNKTISREAAIKLHKKYLSKNATATQ